VFECVEELELLVADPFAIESLSVYRLFTDESVAGLTAGIRV